MVVIVVSPVLASAVPVLRNNKSFEQVTTFKYLSPHLHQSGACTLDQPIQANIWLFLGCCSTAAFFVTMWQDCQLALIFAVLVPVLQYGCQVWGMHSPHVAAAKHARLNLQRLYDYYLRTTCDLLPSTPRRMLLVERVCCLCKCCGGGKPCNFETAWLRCLWAPSTTRSAWTILLMPSKGVLAVWVAVGFTMGM